MTLDPAIIEQLRRSGIRIDREGEFQHEGAPVTHVGLREALFRWLDRSPDGRWILRLDAQRFVYVDVDDTPLVARAARVEGGAVFIALSESAEERLDPATLTIDEQGVMRCWVRGGRLEARLANSAAAVLADLIDYDVDGDGGVGRRPGRAVLTIAGQRFPLGPRSAAPP